MNPSLQAVHQPVQARSLASFQRILKAAEELMADAPFEKVSVQDIIRRAGVPTGSFYARFSSKQALLALLYENYIADMEAVVERELPPIERLDPEQSLAATVKLICRLYRERRGIVRSAYLHFRTSAPQVEILDSMASRHAGVVGRVHETVTHAAARMKRDDPERAARFILKMIFVSAREHFLFPEQARTILITDSEFETELTRTVVAYLAPRSSP